MVLHLYGVEVPALVNPSQLLRRTEEWISLLAKRRHDPLDVREISYCKECEIDCDAEEAEVGDSYRALRYIFRGFAMMSLICMMKKDDGRI